MLSVYRESPEAADLPKRNREHLQVGAPGDAVESRVRGYRKAVRFSGLGPNDTGNRGSV